MAGGVPIQSRLETSSSLLVGGLSGTAPPALGESPDALPASAVASPVASLAAIPVAASDFISIEYYSDNEKEWFECIVIGVDSIAADGGVNVIVNGHEKKVPKKELATRLRKKPVVIAVSGEVQWTKGEKAKYYSDSQQKWYHCIVVGAETDGGVKVEVSSNEKRGWCLVPKEKLTTHLEKAKAEEKVAAENAAVERAAEERAIVVKAAAEKAAAEKAAADKTTAPCS